MFNFIIGFQDYIFSRQKGENKKYVSSFLYYLYDRNILSEDFWLNYLNGNIQKKYQSMLNSNEGEKELREAAKDFSNWIQDGPYEGEEVVKKDEENKDEEKDKEKNEDEEDLKKDKKKNKKKSKKKKDKDKKEEEKEAKKEKKEENKGENQDNMEEKDVKKELEHEKKEEEIDIDEI